MSSGSCEGLTCSTHPLGQQVILSREPEDSTNPLDGRYTPKGTLRRFHRGPVVLHTCLPCQVTVSDRMTPIELYTVSIDRGLSYGLRRLFRISLRLMQIFIQRTTHPSLYKGPHIHVPRRKSHGTRNG